MSHDPLAPSEALAFWDGFYAGHAHHSEHAQVGSALVRELADAVPGTALDLGCGEGSDACWLAERGWRVTAVDASAVALDRARLRATEAGLGDRIHFEVVDLGRAFPTGEFDLVSVQYVHSPIAAAGEREAILAAAVRAVAPGGMLLVGSHIGAPTWEDEVPAEYLTPSAEENLAALALDPAEWTVRADLLDVPSTSAAGAVGTRRDQIIAARRRA